ncbi:MAG: MBOAT family protein [Bacteroidaceae bacterium]|nr:MBOAT family protein [Bacteroidaceae bacterium]
MLFNSQEFLLFFLPFVLIGYYVLVHFKLYTVAKVFLLVDSLFFYGYQTSIYLLLLISSIAINFLFYRLIRKQLSLGKQSKAKVVMILGVGLNLASIFYFKYFDFFITNVNLIFKWDVTLLNVVLPLGISFFTFQQVSFLVDTYKGEVDEFSFLDYSLFVSFFPQLIAGPIVLHKDLIGQFSDENRFKFKSENMLVGIRYFVIGLFKKTMVADRLSLLVAYGYKHDSQLSSFAAALVILSYTLQIYFDFSGYSDMAIGLAKMLGFDIPHNFEEPYKAKNISEFWKRWHMTMTRFFTQYVYFPLGGNRKGMARTCLNTMIVFALSGLWHGAGWTFVVWGVMHGVALCFHRLAKNVIQKIPSFITFVATFAFVNLAWVFFRAETFLSAKNLIYSLLLGGKGIVPDSDMFGTFVGGNIGDFLALFFAGHTLDLIKALISLVLLTVFLLVAILAPSSHALATKERIGRYEGIILGIMMVLSLMTFMNLSEFIYFNF